MMRTNVKTGDQQDKREQKDNNSSKHHRLFGTNPANISEYLRTELFDWRAGTEQVPIPVNIVDPCNRWPEFVLACPGRWKRGLLARVRAVPFFGSDLPRSVRRVFKQIILSIRFASCNRFDLGAN